MIQNINFISPNPKIYTNNYSKTKMHYNKSLHCDTVQFTGQSPASFYNTTFEYLASNILKRDKSYQVSNSHISSKLIKQAVEGIFGENKVFTDFELSDYNKIKWKSYIPEDVRIYSVEKVNQARAERIGLWKNVLTNPESLEIVNPKLAKKIKNNYSLQLVIWDAVKSEIKSDNRHIPVPFDDKALLATIERFESIKPIDRSVTCSAPSFIDYYTHRLRDNLLMNMGYKNDTLQKVWIKIPSLRHDPQNRERNIATLEILSNKNWCTRSSVDKAADALSDGDFYIFLRRNKSQIWEPSLGITTYKGKLDQIQGKENDNIIPLDLIPELEKFVEKNNLKYQSGVFDEGPKARQAVLISKKLKEKNEFGMTFSQAIRESDDMAIFDFLKIKSEIIGRNIKIGSYKPYYRLEPTSGINIPISMFGINESSLLKDVEIIDGDMILKHKNNKLFNSKINVFPPKLKKVTGKIVCSKEQYEKFGEDMLRVTGDPNKILVLSR